MWRRRFWLDEDTPFPPVEYADAHGLLAIGGSLSRDRLLDAYRRGIFPWPAEEDAPLLWFSPDPRCVLYPAELRVSRSLRQRIRSGRFEVRFDSAFGDVIRACAKAPRDEAGTWITETMVDAYIDLHAEGHAHSVECWRDDQLVGGLYGIASDGVFCGESMFHRETDASKVAFVALVEHAAACGFRFVDCQLETEHLLRLGARNLRRAHFVTELAAAQQSGARWRDRTDAGGSESTES